MSRKVPDVSELTALYQSENRNINHLLILKSMKSLKLILGLGFLALAATAQADSKVTTVIGGQQIDKDLTKLTFNDKMVTLTFSDSSTETAEMGLIAISFDHGDSSAISEILADPKKAKGVYNLKGQYLGEKPEGLTQGIYIVNGQKVYVK